MMHWEFLEFGGSGGKDGFLFLGVRQSVAGCL